VGSRPFNFAFVAFVLIVSLTDSLVKKLKLKKLTLGSRDGVVMIKLASHPGSGHEWLSWLLGLYSALRGFSLGSPVFPSPQKSTFSNSNLIGCRTFLKTTFR